MHRYSHHFVTASLAVLATSTVVTAPVYAQPAAAQQSESANRLTIADYFNWEDVANPALSPDGKQILYTRTWIDQLNDKRESSVWIMNVDGTRNRFLVKGSDAKWSPDGSRISYIAPGEPSGTQIWVRYMDAEGATTQITRLTEAPSDVEWSPDGKTLAFGMLVRQNDDWRIAMPAPPRGAKWTEAPRVVTKVRYRADRQGFLENGLRQLFTVPADGGTPRQVTTGDWAANGTTWMPDGKAFVFTSLRTPDAEYAWRETEIYKVDVASGAITQLTRHKGPDNNPVPSPDGTLIAYTGYDSTDATWQDAAIRVMDADGGNVRVLTAKLDRSPSGMFWAPDGSGLYFNVENHGSRNLYFVNLKGDYREVTRGAQLLTVTGIGANLLAVGTNSTSSKPTDIVALDLRPAAGATPTPRQLTDVNGDVLAGKRLATTEEVWYTSVDGMKIQGWIVKPADFDPKRKYPIMLEIHGGPHSAYGPTFAAEAQMYAAAGYVVVYSNPRGSTSYGGEFGALIHHNYPSQDYDDLMSVTDAVIAKYPIDTAKLFVTGGSGGGVLTAWIVGANNRFAAAMVQKPVINWTSHVLSADGGVFYARYWFGEMPWAPGAQERYWARSPLSRVGNVKTPTAVLVGEEDNRTPHSEAEQYYQALQIQKVPTELVLVPGASHDIAGRPTGLIAKTNNTLAWFARYGGPPVPDPVTGESTPAK